MQARWEEMKVILGWILGSGFAAVIAFLALIRPATDAAWDKAFERNRAKAKERIAAMFDAEISRWDQAAVDAGAALQVLGTLEELTRAVDRQGQALERISGFLEGSTGWNGIERRRDG